MLPCWGKKYDPALILFLEGRSSLTSLWALLTIFLRDMSYFEEIWFLKMGFRKWILFIFSFYLSLFLRSDKQNKLFPLSLRHLPLTLMNNINPEKKYCCGFWSLEFETTLFSIKWMIVLNRFWIRFLYLIFQLTFEEQACLILRR